MFHTAQQSTSKQSTFRLGSIFSSWSLDFCYQYFQQRGELCIKLYTNSIYLFSSNRSVTPFNSLSLLFPSISFCVPCFLRVRMYECESVCVCFFVLVKTHSFICSLSLLFQILLCVNPLYTFWTKRVCVALFLCVCISSYSVWYSFSHSSINWICCTRIESDSRSTHTAAIIYFLKGLNGKNSHTAIYTFTHTHTHTHTNAHRHTKQREKNTIERCEIYKHAHLIRCNKSTSASTIIIRPSNFSFALAHSHSNCYVGSVSFSLLLPLKPLSLPFLFRFFSFLSPLAIWVCECVCECAFFGVETKVFLAAFFQLSFIYFFSLLLHVIVFSLFISHFICSLIWVRKYIGITFRRNTL